MTASSLAQQLGDLGIEDRDLVAWVLTHAQHAAGCINEQGLQAQVTYLLQCGETEATILGALGFAPDDATKPEEAPDANLEGALAHCAQALRQLSAVAETGAPSFQPGGVGFEALQRADQVLQDQARSRRRPGGNVPSVPDTA